MPGPINLPGIEDHRRNPATLEWETLVDGKWGSASQGDKAFLNSEFPSGGGGGITFITGQRFQFLRDADGRIFAADTTTGERKSGVLSLAGPPDPAKPNIVFLTDKNTGAFFAYDKNADLAGIKESLVVISTNTQIQRGFQHIFEASQAIRAAGLNPDKYHFLYEDKRVVPTLIEDIPPAQDSFSVVADASGRLLVVSRLTGKATRLEDTPRASDIAAGATVTIDEATGKFKVTQPDGSISFPAALNPRELQTLGSVKIGGQFFAFNATTGQFVQVRQPDRQFEPDVVFKDGRAFTRDVNGNLTPLGREEIPDINDLINSRLAIGDAKGAVALADFRDRPTSIELFNAALEFAQSPGDLAAISGIARGQSLVAPPPSGTVQRVAQQPEILRNTFQKLFSRGSGTPQDLMDVVDRITKEFDEQKKARKKAEEERDKSEKKNQQLNNKAAIDKALAEFRKSKGGSGRDPDKTGPGAFTAITGTNRFEDKRAEFEAAGFTDFDAVVAGFTGMTLEQIISGLGNTLRSRAAAGTDTSKSEAGEVARVARVKEEERAAIAAIAAREEAKARAARAIISSGATAPPPSPAREFDEEEEDDPAPPPVDAPPPPPDDEFDVEEPDEPPAPPPPDDEFDFEEEGVDLFARGGVTRGSNLEIVGEKGPELVDLPPGTRVIPHSELTTDKVKKLRKMGIRGMQGGGITDPLLPFGVRRALAGVLIEPTRRRLSRAAGIPVLSAQARQNLLPEELEVFNRLSKEAGIPEGAFRQEQESAFPGANLARGRARSAPRVLR